MRDRRSIITALGFIATIAVLAVAGSVLAAGVLSGQSEREAADTFPAPAGANLPTSFAVADDVPTSFGAMSVKHAERLDGVGASELGGMTHGVGGLVDDKQQRLQASVTLTNLLDRPIPYGLERFTLRTAKGGKGIKVTAASLKPGTLQPDASIDVRLDFTAPRSAKRFWIDFADPGREGRTTVALGSAEDLRGRPAPSPEARRAMRKAAQTATTFDKHDNGHGE